MKRSKAYQAATKLMGEKELFSLEEAVALITEMPKLKFDQTVEIHFRLNANVKHADQIVRATTILPNGSGKSPRIAAFVGPDREDAVKKAGADQVGTDHLIEQINKGEISFDIAVATPDQMKLLGKVAKTLGQKGLMPNPKSGTVTEDIETAIKELKLGKLEFRTDKDGIVHTILGKMSFGKEKLFQNAKAMIKAVLDAKPSGIKSIYMKGISISASMSPGVAVELADAIAQSK